ncbi:hypothetical protein GGR57DRAFT_382776 [Xylariaceae sp. FL1272]|nr:hypothetical protein GGR57DRAFT_382776 [Xylariaceae sp. FL1272]
MASFDDTSPSSDAYAAQRSPHAPWPFVPPDTQAKFERKHLAPGATINFQNLPRAAWWIPAKERANLVLWNVAGFATNAHRPLEQHEVDAVAQNTVRAHQWRSLVMPTASVVAAVATYAGRKTFRFPFYTPNPKSFSPRAFPSKHWKIAEGEKAETLWNATRLATYFTFGTIGFNILFGSIQGSTFAANVLRDDRLKAITRSIAENVRTQRSTQRGQQQHTRSPTSPGPVEQPYQDNTPQDYSDYSEDNTWNSSTSSQGNTYTAPPQQQTSTSPEQMRRPSPAWTPLTTGTRAQDDDLDLFDDDDASPVAASARVSEPRQKASNSPSTTSWEQIRQQARSGSAQWARGDSSGQEKGWAQLRQDTARTTKDATPRSEDFSYSQVDEDKEKRQYEKDKAQKEFDALVDAEREGKVGSSGSGSGGGWRR